jgi:hypothetical protein
MDRLMFDIGKYPIKSKETVSLVQTVEDNELGYASGVVFPDAIKNVICKDSLTKVKDAVKYSFGNAILKAYDLRLTKYKVSIPSFTNLDKHNRNNSILPVYLSGSQVCTVYLAEVNIPQNIIDMTTTYRALVNKWHSSKSNMLPDEIEQLINIDKQLTAYYSQGI